jgi:hypothetical protein
MKIVGMFKNWLNLVSTFLLQDQSGCFRRKQYAEAYCRISSYLQTMANQGLNPLVAIQLALEGKIPGLKDGGGE